MLLVSYETKGQYFFHLKPLENQGIEIVCEVMFHRLVRDVQGPFVCLAVLWLHMILFFSETETHLFVPQISSALPSLSLWPCRKFPYYV
jgi:hypothetical protein